MSLKSPGGGAEGRPLHPDAPAEAPVCSPVGSQPVDGDRKRPQTGG